MRRVTAPAVPMCPRCGGCIPNSETPGAYPGALSRVDNQTEICSSCGSAEASDGVSAGDWYEGWVNPPHTFLDDVEEMLRAESLSDLELLMSEDSEVKTCDHLEWRWLDCDECRETIGVCGEKVCVACGEDVE